MAIFDDPDMVRLAAIEDQIVDLEHVILQTSPENRPAGIAERTRAAYDKQQAKKNAPAGKGGNVIDARAEIARRQELAARGEYSESESPAPKRKSNSKAQEIRAELARRMAAAN